MSELQPMIGETDKESPDYQDTDNVQCVTTARHSLGIG